MNKRNFSFLVFTVILAVFISPFAASSPDGLERVALDLGFMELEKEPIYELFPDYSLPFVLMDHVSTALSGMVGLLIFGLLTVFFGWIFKKRRRTN